MASPYANPYGNLTKVNVQGPSAAEQAKAKQGSANADLLRMLGGAAPVVGGVGGALVGGLLGSAAGPGPGTLAGAKTGAMLGGALGSLGGNALNAGADMQTREAEEADLSRRRRLEALQKVAGLL